MKDYKSLEILRPFERNGSFPIDKTSVFYSYESAVNYAHGDPTAYPGQIISVIDEAAEKTAIYKLDYDKDKVYRLVLKTISVGSNATTAGFTLLGTVETFEDLPELADNGEMYLVSDENVFYVAVEVQEDVIEWKPIDIKIDVVSETTDGVFKHEVYSTFINRSAHKGVYFSSGDGTPENNRWVEVETTTVEDDRNNFTMVSVGRVKQIISTMTSVSKPHVELVSLVPVDNPVNTQIQPRFNITYYPELGGLLKRITIYQGSNDVVILDTIPEIQDLIYDNELKSYTYSFESANMIDSAQRATIMFRVVIQYEQSEDGNMPEGSCENTLSFNYYKSIRCGTNLDTQLTEISEFAKDGDNIVELEYHPENYQEKLDTIHLQIPDTHYLKAVTFVNQNDLFAKSLFNTQDNCAYTYHVNIGFKSPGKFIFYVSEKTL